jgi:hypothetical protein
MEGLGLGGADVQADDLAPPLGIAGDGDYGGNRDDAPALALAEIGGVEPEIGPFAGERSVEEGADPLVDVLAELGDGGLRDAGQAHGLDQVVHPAGRDAADPGFLDDRHQGLLGGLAGLQEGREVGALAQLRDAQLQGAEPGVEGAVAEAVAVVQALAGALVPAGADQALHIGLHEHLQHRLGDAAQEVAVSCFRQELGQWQSVLGHRVLGRLGVGCRNTTRAVRTDDHRNTGSAGGVGRSGRLRRPPRPTPPADPHEFPPLPRTLTAYGRLLDAKLLCRAPKATAFSGGSNIF